MKSMPFSQEVKELFKKYSPQILTTVGAVGFIANTNISSMRTKRMYEALYKATGNEFYKIRVMQITHSNNWLKMHGYPMNRKRNMSKRTSL